MKKDEKVTEKLLMGIYEIAQYFETSPQYISGRVSKRETFPKPITILKCGPIWKTSDIIAYREKHG